MSWSYAPTMRPTSRRRERSVPTSTSSISAFDDGWRIDSRTDRGSRASRRDAARSRSRARTTRRARCSIAKRLAHARAAGRAARAPCCWSTRPTAISPTTRPCRWRPRCRSAPSAWRRCRRRTACRAFVSGGPFAATRDLSETLLAAKEQMVICGATLGRSHRRARCSPIGRGCCHRSSPTYASGWRSCRRGSAGRTIFEWVEPSGGVVGLVRFVPGVRGRHRPVLRVAARTTTAPMSVRVTGSSSTTGTFVSATAGRPTPSSRPGSARCPPPQPRRRVDRRTRP